MASTTNFITNQEKFLSDIINAILPKSKAVDFLVGYFYFSGYSQISQQLKDKPIRILVGLDVDILISKKLREVEDFVETSYGSRTQLKEGWYKKFVKLFNETDFLDTKEKEESFTFFYNNLSFPEVCTI